MRRWLNRIVVTGALLLISNMGYAQVAQSPHWPSARTSGWNLGLNGMSDFEKRQVYDWAAAHYDFITNVDGHYIDYLRSRNPTIGGPGRYEIFTCALAGSEEDQAIQQRAAELRVDVEDAFLHYKQDTVSPIRANQSSYAMLTASYPWLRLEFDSTQSNYKVHVPGWDEANDKNADGRVDDAEFATRVNPTASAREKRHARTVEWTWNPTEWQLNLGAYDLVTVVIDLMDDDVNEPFLWGQSTGYSYLSFDCIHGWLNGASLIAEYPHSAGGDAQVDYSADIGALLAYAKEHYAGRVLIGGNSSKGRWEIDQQLDVISREGLFNTWDTARDWAGALPGGYYGPLNPNSAYFRARAQGKIQSLQHQYNLLYYIADTPAVWARDRIFGVAAYHLLQNPGRDYWAAYRGYGYWPNVENNEKMWSHALEVDIGQPTGAVPPGATPITPWGVWVFAEGADPGHPDYPDVTKSRYRIFAREYTAGLVLLRPKSGSDASRSTFADNTATTHSLGDYYQAVNDDATLGPPVDTVTLRNGEAVILARARPAVSLSASTSATVPDGEVTYEVTCVNPIPDAVSNVRIQGKIPLGTTYVANSAMLAGVVVIPEIVPNPAETGEWLIRVFVPQIAAGGRSVFRYTVKVQAASGE